MQLTRNACPLRGDGDSGVLLAGELELGCLLVKLLDLAPATTHPTAEPPERGKDEPRRDDLVPRCPVAQPREVGPQHGCSHCTGAEQSLRPVGMRGDRVQRKNEREERLAEVAV